MHPLIVEPKAPSVTVVLWLLIGWESGYSLTPTESVG